jgi:hypothetical protein
LRRFETTLETSGEDALALDDASKSALLGHLQSLVAGRAQGEGDYLKGLAHGRTDKTILGTSVKQETTLETSVKQETTLETSGEDGRRGPPKNRDTSLEERFKHLKFLK